jgi:choline kinase
MKHQDFITSTKRQTRVKTNDLVTIALIMSKPGQKMKSYGPVQLLNLNQHILLDIQIEAIKAVHKNFEILICCGFEASKIIKYVKNKYKNLNIRIVENQLFETTNCCETLRLCLNNISANSSLLVCSGDLLLYPELIKIQQDSPYIVVEKENRKISGLEIGSITDDTGVVTNISFGLPNVWSEIFYLHSKDSIEHLRKIVSSNGFSNKLIFEALNEFGNSRFKFTQVINKYSTVKIDNMKTYHKVKEVYESIGPQLFVRNVN